MYGFYNIELSENTWICAQMGKVGRGESVRKGWANSTGIKRLKKVIAGGAATGTIPGP
jgi:hypothetical protein